MDDMSPMERGVAHLTDEEGAERKGETTAAIPTVSRRKALASFTAVGTAGALTGAGMRAFFSDVEVFGNNAAQIGDIDLGLAWESYYHPHDGDRTLVDAEGDCGDDGTFVDNSRPALSLTDVRPGDAGEIKICFRTMTNRSWVWLGAMCPEPGLANVIDASVTFDEGCDGDADGMILASSNEDGETTDISGALCDVLLTLSGGVRLGADCLSPISTHCLTLEWEFPERSYNNQYREYEGDTVEFVLDFHAEQCRHNDDPEPSIARQCSDEPCIKDGPGVSWIAFCADDDDHTDLDEGDVALEVLEANSEGEPTKIGWNSESTPVGTVSIYYGTTDGPIIENFYIKDEVHSGTATIGAGDERTSKFEDGDQSPSNPCPAGETGIKYEWDEDGFTFDA